MSIDKLPSEGEKIFPLSAWERWQLYHRLQVLDIECKCLLHKPLQVCIAGPAQLLQLWTVLRQLETCRGSLIGWLEPCWQA
ncbi:MULTISPECIES: Asr1405/Asl0597 family protein [unclassified Microcystis]|jgi:hypothetical protein|uniref:Asr1405/Asl0597 family protein n=1 Tax=unclassified Microcystis TaxID=2643300 RepID=UPI001191503D|nr:MULTISPECIES: Asr1405/Asl0597 family protein [unclassified Microcystis]MCA2681775.1 hypothetical protein [Microcystis sp. M043S2]MCA2809251.1 hypothetical protein [Microcystis sp. M095S1]MCA2826788.1 hypothetical protein [Microcystis sp. M088S1]MCA2828129.1 hypothetical protein [Microcystis sp. M086S1]MCA2865186.1 hypothetical protein [Microcystis sp. M049S1]MCA2925839.1 hypothetical protein [Microcystis sp. M020S1]MCA2934735.1 hypothetical protein [Microcystis sp. M015S1]MCA2958096.1 hy